MTPDVNVLVAAFRSDHVHHASARAWLTSSLSHAEGMTLLPTVIASFLRLVTHPKVFAEPTPVDDALNFIDVLRQAANTAFRPVDEWSRFKALCTQKQLRANDVPDGWIAAQVVANQLVLATFDRDFRKLLPTEHLHLLQP